MRDTSSSSGAVTRRLAGGVITLRRDRSRRRLPKTKTSAGSFRREPLEGGRDRGREGSDDEHRLDQDESEEAFVTVEQVCDEA